MLNSWFALTMLAIESNDVIALRLAKIARGGSSAFEEVELMIDEKISAGSEAYTALLSGSASLDIIDRYRELVAANHQRLVSTS